MREKYIDTIKGVSIVFVVLLHVVAAGWYGNENPSQWLGYIALLELSSSIAVSMFFVATGMVMLNPQKDVSEKKVLLHNIPRFIIPLVVYSILYEVINYVVGCRKGAFLPTFLKDFARGEIDLSLWFLYAMICSYLALPVIKVFTDHATKKQKEYFLIVWFICGIMEFLQNTQVFSFISIYTNHLEYLNLFLHYVGYLVLGNYIRYETDESKSLGWYIIISLACYLFVVIYVYWQYKNSAMGYTDYTPMNYCSPFNMWITMTVVLVIRKLEIKKEDVQRKNVLTKMGELTLGIYLIHLMLLKVLNGYELWGFNEYYLLQIPVYTVLIVGVSAFASAIIRRVKKVGKYLT